MGNTDPIDPEGVKDVAVSLQVATSALCRLHFVDVDPDLLNEGLPVSDGVLDNSLLERATARFGFKVFRFMTAKLDDLALPCCLELVSGNYIVALERNGDILKVADAVDPTTYRSIYFNDIKCSITHHAFQLLPTTDFLLERHAAKKVEEHWFWGRIFLMKRDLRDVILASLSANLLALVTSLFALQVYDRVIPGQSEPTLWVLASGAGLAILFEAVLRIVRARLIDRVGKETEIDITSDLFARMLAIKLDERPASPSAIAHMVREFSTIKEFFTNAAIGVIADLPFAFIFLLLIYGIAGHVVWVIIIGAGLIVMPNFASQTRMAQLSKETMGGMSSASRLLNESAYMLETLKITNSGSFLQRQWEEVIALIAIKTTEQRSLRAFLIFWAAAIQQATYVFAVIACVYLIFDGNLSAGAIIAVGILSTRTLTPISQLSQALSSWQNMKVSLNALDKLMNAQQERDPDRSYIRRSRLKGSVLIKNTQFAHKTTKSKAVDIANLEITAGTRLAILGTNGSGKSSLLKLVAGLYEPSAGEILMDGLDIRQIDPNDLRKNIGLLTQEVQMFQGSLRDNLAPGSLSRSDQNIFEALTFAGLGDFVKDSAEGLDLKIHDGGTGLSTGQRQCIGLARLYLQDPAVILLDEPTSALDQNLESAVVPRIGNWIGSRTCIVATHRPQILSIMTHIAVLQRGKMILYGERDPILKKLTIPSETSNKVDQ